MTTPFVPIPGQCFTSLHNWLGTATHRLTDHPLYLDTQQRKRGDPVGYIGLHWTALCFDQLGRRCYNGGDFMRADKENAYPIWYVWPDQIAQLIMPKE